MQLHEIRGPCTTDRLAGQEHDQLPLSHVPAFHQHAFHLHEHFVGARYVGSKHGRDPIIHGELPRGRVVRCDGEDRHGRPVARHEAGARSGGGENNDRGRAGLAGGAVGRIGEDFGIGRFGGVRRLLVALFADRLVRLGGDPIPTSLTSARVGVGRSIIDSSICVAVMTKRLLRRARRMIDF
jgi:hypothetical protein